MKSQKPSPISPGHNACAGCGQLVAVRAVMRGVEQYLKKDPENGAILTSATGCLEVVSTPYPQSAWGLPWLHSLFENSGAIASGIKAALNFEGKKKIKVIAQGGDGATYDIGLGLLSGLWERGDEVLYICYDTEAYSNTGVQSSGATPYGADTTTSPVGEDKNCQQKKTCDLVNYTGHEGQKKDMLQIALAHRLNYVAQTTAGFPDDITNKVLKALATPGPSYIQILSPCVPGWKISLDQAVNLGKLAVKTGLYPILEYVNGELNSSSINSNFKAEPLEEYFKLQGRFKHLFKEENKKEWDKIKGLVSNNLKKYVK